ncbi:phage/plasmid replication protein [Thauera aromatica]|uniref:phage/plasmid replication domain-containing protein n=1 Tax=Thauera aromatica TaxID=59405 RepID=UPI001FFD4332|nr:phage/plasmid replication protein [Thauera aromatica]MCK2088644.1 phage/plasmid replication protein [Thauera aromatica]
MNFDFLAPCCDWLTIRHDYPVERPAEPRNGGKVLKVSADGELEWESASWESIRCPSSDTSIRVKCDGKRLYASANIGRFQRGDNMQGFTVMECIERWAKVLSDLGFDLHGFGTRWREGTVAEWGTHITRVDLAGNHWTSNYGSLAQGLMVRRLGQKLPQLGKYGPTWGYDAKRSNWVKAKLYDKDAEQQGKRRSGGGATTARFEVQLGSEFLKREGLDKVKGWSGGEDMGKVIYVKFAEQVFREQLSVQRWDELPARLQHWATCWREGRDIRSDLSTSQYYKVRKQLLEYGIDVGTPCNVLALTRHVQVVEVSPLPNLIVPAEAA